MVALATAQSLTDPIVSVNGEAIVTSDYYRRMSVLPGVGRIAGGRFVQATPGFLTLQQLINERLMIQLARKNNVEPTEADITAEIEFRVKEDPEFVRAFLRSGLTEADLRHDLRVQLSEFNVSTMGVTITDFQVEKYYQDQQRQFTLPKRYRLRVIAAVGAEKKQAIDAELAKGTAFSDVATRMSEDLTRVDGGLLGNLAESALGDNMKTIVATMAEGAVSPWLEGESGTEIKIFLEDIMEAEVLPFDDVLKQKIWRRLMLDRGLVRNNMAQLMKDMRDEVQLTFTGTTFDEQLKQAFGG